MSCKVFTVKLPNVYFRREKENTERMDTEKLCKDMANLKNCQRIHIDIDPHEAGTICYVTIAKSPEIDPETVTTIFSVKYEKIHFRISKGHFKNELHDFLKLCFGNYGHSFQEVYKHFGYVNLVRVSTKFYVCS
jgi:hypothetical protein